MIFGESKTYQLPQIFNLTISNNLSPDVTAVILKLFFRRSYTFDRIYMQLPVV